MSVDRGDPEMRIPRNIDDTDQFYGFRTEDFVVALTPFFTALFISQSLLPETLAVLRLPLFASSILIGGLMLFFTPNHLTTREWIESIGHYIRRPKDVRHVSLEGNQAREGKDFPDEARAWELNERAQEITRVHRIHRDVGAVERDDGVFVGAVKVNPANMALASSARWDRMVKGWRDFINHNLDFPIQIYCTTEVLPVDEYMRQYEARASDRDIANRPIMKALLDDFTDWYPQYLSWQGTNQREYYIITTCSESELRETVVGEKGFIERLGDLPFIGKYFERYRASRDERSEGEIEEALVKSVEQRCRTIVKEGIMSLDGCSAERVSGVELAVMIKDYWQSTETDLDLDTEDLRSQPVVTYDDSTTFGTEYIASDGGFGDLKSPEARKDEVERIEAEKRHEKVDSGGQERTVEPERDDQPEPKQETEPPERAEPPVAEDDD